MSSSSLSRREPTNLANDDDAALAYYAKLDILLKPIIDQVIIMIKMIVVIVIIMTIVIILMIMTIMIKILFIISCSPGHTRSVPTQAS